MQSSKICGGISFRIQVASCQEDGYFFVTDSPVHQVISSVAKFGQRSAAERSGVERSGRVHLADPKLLLFPSDLVAIAREKQLKKWSRSKKDQLIARVNPELHDLGLELV